MNHIIHLLLILSSCIQISVGFQRIHSNINSHVHFPSNNNIKAPNTLFASQQKEPRSEWNTESIFPVIRRISGINWTGNCRYVGADLIHASNLKLFGGIRYDINGSTVLLSSFLTFPNGNTREVMMEGSVNDQSHVLKLSSTDEGGPIHMLLTELAPDTILINEIEESSGKIVLTASISIVEGSNGMELAQVSHEVGEGNAVFDGHQVWRLTAEKPIKRDKFDLINTTGR
uniref:Uncharacterized protein n=1 Tax=Proboscia inermis TaxID=420281 RepID=A0A7S0CMU3_9STRA|mmetsp:Transcript_7205/g.7359  ORF Transcript_7205/g.7359 Transcript_7205/m.7359 type:complete len:230 (+) Transcript_7205:140-829(+)